jgi:cysteine synthase
MTNTRDRVIAVHAPLSVVPLGANLAALDFRLMKVFPAFNIIETARRNGDLVPGMTVVETSSGTMAAGLGVACKSYGFKLHIFGDPAIEAPLKRTMEALGAEVVIVDANSSDGNVQQLRKEALLKFMKTTNAFWTRQYDNLDNSLAYAAPAAEAIRQLGKIDIVVATTGSGGSSCGLARYIRRFFPEMTLVGIDTFGSVLFGQPAGPRPFRGLGNSILPGNLNHTAFDWVHWLGANEGFHAASTLLRNTGLKRGPTSGAAYLVAKWYAEQFPDKRVLAVFPDDGARYEHTVFNPLWMEANGYKAESLAGSPVLIEHPMEANCGWAMMNWRRRTLIDVKDSPAAMPRTA